MRLAELDAKFIGGALIKDGDVTLYRQVDTIAAAQGVRFQCPLCAKGKPQQGGHVVGCHYVICWFGKTLGAEPVPPTAQPGPGRWNPSGTGLHDLTFIGPGAVSVQLTGGCGWHGFVRNGSAI